MLKPRICGILALLLGCQSLMAQDTLINDLEGAREDTNKVMLYYKTGAGIIYQNPQTAMKYFRAGVDLAIKLNYTSGVERCLGAVSFTFTNLSKYDSALVYINLSIPYAKKAGELKRLTLAYINRADVHTNLYNLSAALKDCDTAMQYAEKMTGNSDALGRITGLMADIYLEQKQYTAAEMNMDRSTRYFERTTNRRMVALSYSDKADLYNILGQPEKALPLLQEAIRIGDSLDDKQNLSAYYGSLNESLARLKRYDEGRQAGRRAIKLSEETGNIRQQAVVYVNLAEIEHKTKNIKLAIDYAEKAFQVFKTENDTLRQHNVATNLAEYYQSANNDTKAYEYLKISKEFGDSLTRRQFSEETTKLQTTYEVKEKDKEIQLLSKEKELQNQRLQKQRFLMIGATVIALLVLAGGWLLYNRNRLRQRMNELELRNRIAADLHDEVGSSLSSIHMLSQMASQKAVAGAQQDILSRMSSNARETMDKMGDIVWMIKPSDTEAGSLKHRMERFAYEVGISKNIEVAIQLEELEKLRLNMEQRRNIYLIFKEAVNNAAKYSEAKKIDIASLYKNRELRLVIKDEGKGFDHSKTRKGNGLDNMSKRAAELGGRLDINSLVNNGTTVALVMPL
jgi:two-component system sensor histidine kinase UhpB